jgi:hypothetical protein
MKLALGGNSRTTLSGFDLDNLDVLLSGFHSLTLNGKSNKGQFQPQHDLGNGSWGKIDFLVNHCGYRQMFVAEW